MVEWIKWKGRERFWREKRGRKSFTGGIEEKGYPAEGMEALSMLLGVPMKST